MLKNISYLLFGIILIIIPMICGHSFIAQLRHETDIEKAKELEKAKNEYGRWQQITYVRGEKISERKLTDEEVRAKHSNAEPAFWFMIILMYIFPPLTGVTICYKTILRIYQMHTVDTDKPRH